MDEAVTKHYRRLFKMGFPNAGSYENPSVFIDTTGARARGCMGTRSYVRIYIKIEDGVITGMKYLCSCDPAGNVAVEILCDLVRGKTLAAATALTKDRFTMALGSPSEDLLKRAAALLEILGDGIKQYQAVKS